MYEYDVGTKVQSSQWKTQVKSNVKIMLIVFFDWKGITYHEFLLRGEKINRFRYRETLKHLREAMRKKRPEMWTSEKWLLRHANGPVQPSLVIRDFCTKNTMTVIPQPPYSPDLAPVDFFLFHGP